jgi:N-acetylglucosaminylphosphatidylinositol deacetylase
MKALKEVNRALLVIAHPDDEAMFFCPILQFLISNGCEVSIFCFSNGNADGLGLIREQELAMSANHLGITQDLIEIYNHPQLQDGMDRKWPIDLIEKRLKTRLQTEQIDLVSKMILLCDSPHYDIQIFIGNIF